MIIGMVFLYEADKSAYPFDFTIPSLDFVDRLIIFCGTQNDVALAANVRYSVCAEVVHLGGELFHQGHISQRFNDGLNWVRQKYPNAEYIVKTDADLYLTDSVKAPFFKWMEHPEWSKWHFHIPVMRVVLYSCTYENYFGFAAFPNRAEFEFVGDGAYLNKGGYNTRAEGRGFEDRELAGVELGQASARQLALKEIRNQLLFAGPRYWADLGRWFVKEKNLETYLKAVKEKVETYQDWANGGLAGYERFVNSEVGKKYLIHYNLEEEAEKVRALIWQPLRETGRK